MHIATAVPLLDLSRRLVHQTDAQTLTVVAGDRPGSYTLTIERNHQVLTTIQIEELPTLLVFLEIRGQADGWSIEPSPWPPRWRTFQENNHAE